MAAIARVERRLANEPVHAGLGAKPAVGVLSDNVDGRALYPGDLPGRRLDDFRLEVVCLRPAQVHPQEHLRPVLRLGTARARLDVEVRAIGVHFAGKHAPEFEYLDTGLECFQVSFDFGHRGSVVLIDGENQKLVRVPQAAPDVVEPGDDLLQLRPLLAQRLRPLGIVPDVGLLQLALNLGQTFRLLIVVKDTSLTRLRVQ
jgi:hypothetical protein